jgi:outer membrane receptor protein involved in Fe transport
VGLQFEALNRNYDTADRTLQDWGWYGQLVWRLPEPWHRWVLGLRYDWLSNKPIGSPNTSNGIDQTIPVDTDGAKRYRVSPNITFFPSEFTKVRLQYDYDKQENITAQQAINLEFEFIIGAHGAHKF